MGIGISFLVISWGYSEDARMSLKVADFLALVDGKGQATQLRPADTYTPSQFGWGSVECEAITPIGGKYKNICQARV